jgi:hypothetical protein
MGFKKEPAAWIAVISAGIALAVGFGLNVTEEQVGLILAFVNVAAGLFVRSQVTPTGTLK